MEKLERFLKLDKDVIKSNNEKFINMNLYDKLTAEEKYVLTRYKGPSHGMDKYGLFGYDDYNKLFIDPEKFLTIDVNHLDEYVVLYRLNDSYDDMHLNLNDLKSQLGKILDKINNKRKSNIIKCVNHFDHIIRKGIHYPGYLYRVMRTPFMGTEIKNFTSWSMYPQIGFCDGNCHIYIVKLPKKMKAWYMEYDIQYPNNEKDQILKDIGNFGYYEYEFLLPRNITFRILKTVNFSMPMTQFDSKANKDKTKMHLQVTRIEITGYKYVSPKEIVNKLPASKALKFNE
uniref:Uncharacterized protein n=1 Tax=viral metagenome TaxID=1070528 RepID=A0A6C0CAX6_9ZZZZ